MEQLGIIPRSVNYLFSSLGEGKDIVNYQVTVSAVEIYKEQTRDLLNTSAAKKRKRLEIFVSGKEVIIKHLTECVCKDVDEVLSYILRAQSARNTKATDFIGHNSSRSHCVVMIAVTQRLLDDTVKSSKVCAFSVCNLLSVCVRAQMNFGEYVLPSAHMQCTQCVCGPV